MCTGFIKNIPFRKDLCFRDEPLLPLCPIEPPTVEVNISPCGNVIYTVISSPGGSPPESPPTSYELTQHYV